VDHTVLIDKFFRDRDLRVHIEWNCLQPPYDHDRGWPLRLPVVDWTCTDLVVVVFQDFVTMQDGHCRELLQVEQAYDQHAHRVVVLHWPHGLERYYQGPLRLIEFNVHEYMILNNLAQCAREWQHVYHQPRDLAWQCLNGRKCPHRLRVAQHLQQHWHGGTVSLADVLPLPHYPYSTYRGTSNEDNWLRLLPVYGQHRFNIVTETQYDQQPGIITEKTFFALLAAQIPIVIGYRGMIQDCVDMGFDMFTDLVDISYDNLPDSERWQAALDLNQDVVSNYCPSAAVASRLRDQAQWLLNCWPRAHIDQALKNLDGIMAQGWQ
jgi:hypothetical protein